MQLKPYHLVKNDKALIKTQCNANVFKIFICYNLSIKIRGVNGDIDTDVFYNLKF